jgi:hypothetical protein
MWIEMVKRWAITAVNTIVECWIHVSFDSKQLTIHSLDRQLLLAKPIYLLLLYFIALYFNIEGISATGRVVWDATCGKILLEIVLPQMLHDFEISCPVVARVFSSIYLSQYALSLPINHSSALEDVLQIIRYDASTSEINAKTPPKPSSTLTYVPKPQSSPV